MTGGFYCQIKCGEVGFSIDQWNKSYREIEAMPISEQEKQKLLFPDPCTKQCFDCMAIVGDRRNKTQQLIKPTNP
jgi:hypothetical protein